MTGCITKKNGKFYPILYLGQDELTKKKTYKWGTGHASKKEADKELRKMLSSYDKDEIIFNISESFNDVYEQWKYMIAPELYKSKQTYITNTGYVNNHIMPLLENVRIDKITTQHIQRLFFQMKKADGGQLSPATKKKIYGILNSIFNNAKKWGLVSSNPCIDIELKAPIQQDIDVWNLEQLYYFLNIDFVKESKYYLPFLILSTTGMRRGEVCGLRWGDFDGNSLYLRRSMDIFGEETDMKTRGSHRRIDLMSNVICELNSKKNIQSILDNALNKIPVINGYICTNENNDPINPSTLTKVFRKFLIRNNKENDYILPVVPLKNLRHSYATAALASDINIKIVSETLGHARTSTTQNFYQGAATRTLQQEAVTKMENLIFGKGLEKGLENKKKA